MSNANNRQVAGNHYCTGYQHWDFAAAHFGPGYFKGQITKYVMRWRKKNGVQDLEKALHFLEKMAEVNWPVLGWSVTHSAVSDVDQLAKANGLEPIEQDIVRMVTYAATATELQYVANVLRGMINRAKLDAVGAEPQAHGYVNQD